MDLGDTNLVAIIICALAILVGLIGIVVPILPGLILCWGGVLVWAILGDGGWIKWLVLAVVTLFAIGGTVIKFLWPGRNLKRSGVPTMSLVLGGLLAIVGFFVVPVVGLVLGFILGVWGAEWVRLKEAEPAWRSAWLAIKATGLSILIELTFGFAIAAAWVIALLSI